MRVAVPRGEERALHLIVVRWSFSFVTVASRALLLSSSGGDDDGVSAFSFCVFVGALLVSF
jgi:hypothetical protein